MRRNFFKVFCVLSLCGIFAVSAGAQTTETLIAEADTTDGMAPVSEINLLDMVKRPLLDVNLVSPYVDSYNDYLRFDPTLPDVNYFLDNLTQPQVGMTLMPYTGSTKYNYDPVYKKRIILPQDEPVKKIGGYRMYPKGSNNFIYAPRLQLSQGGIGTGFFTDLNDVLTVKFWNFRAKKARRRTLLALANYSDTELDYGRYEYYFLDETEFALNFTGSNEAQEKINLKLCEYDALKRGLLYFKYTSAGQGEFTVYLPQSQYMRGTFIRDWKGYTLLYQGIELSISFSQTGVISFKMQMNLTKELQSLFPGEQIEKVVLVTSASRISSGNDRN